MRSMKSFHGELCSSDRSGQPDNLSENTRVEQTHDGSGQPDERNCSSAHTVKEQFAPEDNRDIASINTDNEFNRAINEEDIDFNIPRLPHSAVKQSHGASVRDLIQKIDKPPSSTCTSTRSSTTSTIQSLQPRIKRHDSWRWEHWTVRTTRCGTQSTVQSLLIILGRRNRLLHVRALLAKRNRGEQEICPVHHGSPLDSQLLHQERATPRAPLREETRDHEYFIANSLKKKCKKKNFLEIHDRFIRDERFRKNIFDIGRTEQICCEMDELANEDHTHHLTPEEIRGNRPTGGSVRTQLVPTRCPEGIALISNKHCQPCDSSRTRRIQLITKSSKALPHLGGTGKIPGGFLHLSITATLDPALIDQGNLMNSDWAHYSRYDSQNSLGAELQFKIQ